MPLVCKNNPHQRQGSSLILATTLEYPHHHIHYEIIHVIRIWAYCARLKCLLLERCPYLRGCIYSTMCTGFNRVGTWRCVLISEGVMYRSFDLLAITFIYTQYIHTWMCQYCLISTFTHTYTHTHTDGGPIIHYTVLTQSIAWYLVDQPTT